MASEHPSADERVKAKWLTFYGRFRFQACLHETEAA